MTHSWRFRRQFWTFFSAAFFFDAGFSVFFFLFNLYLVDLGYTERAIGSINGVFTLGSMLGTLPGGEIARRWGVRPLLFGCFTAAPLLGIARAFAPGPATQMVMAALAGLAMGCWGVCFLPAVSRLTTEAERPSAFSLIFSISVGTGALGGVLCSLAPRWLQAAGVSLPPAELKCILLVGACAFASLGLLAIAHLPLLKQETAAQAQEAFGSINAICAEHGWRIEPVLIRVLLCMSLWYGVLAVVGAFANVYLIRTLGVPLTRLALLFSLAQIAQFSAGLCMPMLIRKFGRLNAIASTQIIAGVLLGAFGRTHHLSLAAIFYVLLIAVQWMSSPALYDLLMQITPDFRRSTVASFAMFGNALAASGATTLAGFLLVRFGYHRVLPALAGAAIFIALLLRWGFTSRRAAATRPISFADRDHVYVCKE